MKEQSTRTRPALINRAGGQPSGRHGPYAVRPVVAVPPPAVRSAQPLCVRPEAIEDRCAVELVQRGRMILDVSIADLEAAERTYGSFHATTWHFRNALGEAQRTWIQLGAELGTRFVEAALNQPPLAVLILGRLEAGSQQVKLTLIGGRTYRAQAIVGTALAPIQWRLTRLNPPLDHGPYYICRLADGSTQCDCAEWTYRIAEAADVQQSSCKHIGALVGLGWI